MNATFYSVKNTTSKLHSEYVGTTKKELNEWIDATITAYQNNGFYIKQESINEIYFLKGTDYSILVEIA